MRIKTLLILLSLPLLFYPEQGAAQWPVYTEDIVADAQEVQPVFRGGGADTFVDWVQKHVMYQDYGFLTKTGVVSVSFTVDKKGKIRDIETRSSDSELEREARIMIGRAPKMIPGTRNGQPAEFRWDMDIEFSPTILFRNMKKEDYKIKYPNDDLYTRPCFSGKFKDDPKAADGEFRKWLLAKIIPKSTYAPSCSVVLTFVINEGGYLENVEITKSTNKNLNKLIMEILYTCPKWYSPARYDGKPIKVSFELPLVIM